MSRKNVLRSKKFVVDEDMSADFTSDPIDVNYLDNVSLQFIHTLSVDWEGTLSVEVTNTQSREQGGTAPDETVWTSIGDFTPDLPILLSGTGSFMITLNQVPFARLRVVWTSDAGTGTASIIANAKMV